MDGELLKWGASLGVGGILAGGMFAIYRRDALTTREQRDALTAAITRHAVATERIALLLTSYHETNVAALKRIEAGVAAVGGDIPHEVRSATQAAVSEVLRQDREHRKAG